MRLYLWNSSEINFINIFFALPIAAAACSCAYGNFTPVDKYLTSDFVGIVEVASVQDADLNLLSLKPLVGELSENDIELESFMKENAQWKLQWMFDAKETSTGKRKSYSYIYHLK